MQKDGAATGHDHAAGAWVCKLSKVPPPGHACTYHSDEPGPCAWCGSEMVREDSLQELPKEKIDE